MNNTKQGSGLFVVLIIATAIGIGVYSSISLVTNEFRLNKRSVAYHEAKQAAEALLQASMADLSERFDNESTLTPTTLSPSNSPLRISDEFAAVYGANTSNSHLILPADPDNRRYTSTSQFGSEETEIIGGLIPPGQWSYIDPRIPGNEDDEMAGTRVFKRDIEIVGRATVERPLTGKQTVHARQFLQVRDAPLFAYAIFYNLPMEIAPGANMVIDGNVHSNFPAWIQSSGSLLFKSKVTIAGDLSHGRHPDYGPGGVSNGNVKFRNAEGDDVNLKKDSSWNGKGGSFSDTWLESNYSDFWSLALDLWGGNVMTSKHGILPQNPVGVQGYVEDHDSDKSGKQSLNNAYTLIQPPLKDTDLTIPSDTTDSSYLSNKKLNAVERQKYSYKAGLTIKVADDGSISYVSNIRNSDNTLSYGSDNKPETLELTPKEAFATYKPFTEKDGEIIKGLHDKRQGEDLNIVEIDISKLKDLVHANSKDDWGGDSNKRPESWWNGVVYVEFPQQNASSTRADGVNPAIKGKAVKLVNGETIPNPSFGYDDSGPKFYGMSLATNQMLYVEGNYNADGDRSTGSSTEPDTSSFAQQGHEAPAALIADSITFLSTEWEDVNSNKKKNDYRRAKDTEVSAAIMTGLVPSGETGSNSYSGGVENFPRFLENWGGKNIRLRGSIVALFESEVGTEKWGSGDTYNAPKRDWGFNKKFAEGYLPPGTPNTRRYKGMDFQLITKNQYNAHVDRIKTYF